MGQQQSTNIRNKIYGNISTRRTASVLSMLATSTSSVSRNAQSIALSIDADDVGDISILQSIESYINMANMIQSSNETELADSIRLAVKEDINETIRTNTDGLAIFAKPENRQLLNEFITNVDNIIDTSITNQNISEILIQNDALQDSILTIKAKNVGNIAINQSIHAKQTAENVIDSMLNVISSSDVVSDLEKNLEIESDIKEESPLSKLPRMLWLIVGIIIAVILLIMAFLFSGFGIRITLVLLAIIAIIAGIILSRSQV